MLFQFYGDTSKWITASILAVYFLWSTEDRLCDSIYICIGYRLSSSSFIDYLKAIKNLFKSWLTQVFKTSRFVTGQYNTETVVFDQNLSHSFKFSELDCTFLQKCAITVYMLLKTTTRQDAVRVCRGVRLLLSSPFSPTSSWDRGADHNQDLSEQTFFIKILLLK